MSQIKEAITRTQLILEAALLYSSLYAGVNSVQDIFRNHNNRHAVSPQCRSLIIIKEEL